MGADVADSGHADALGKVRYLSIITGKKPQCGHDRSRR